MEENKMHVYDKKTSDYVAKNLTLADFEDVDPRYLNASLREIYQKLENDARPKAPAPGAHQLDHSYAQTTDLFV